MSSDGEYSPVGTLSKPLKVTLRRKRPLVALENAQYLKACSRISHILFYFLQMSTTPNNTPSKKVAFFSHFPHYFLKPYTAQPRVERLTDLLSKLNTKNCEWFLRPYLQSRTSSRRTVARMLRSWGLQSRTISRGTNI